MYGRVKLIIFLQRLGKQVRIWFLFPDFQSPRILRFNINRLFSRAVKIYLKPRDIDHNPCGRDICPFTGIGVFFPKSIAGVVTVPAAGA